MSGLVPADPQARERLARVVAFALSFLACVGANAGVVGANAGSHYALVRALADGRLAIDDYFGYSYGVDYAARDGHFYTNKSPVTALLALPFYLAGRALGSVLPSPTFSVGVDAGSAAVFYVLLFPALAAAATALLVLVLSRQLGASLTAAGVATAVAAFGTLNWRYGTALFSHVPSAAFVLGAAALAVVGKGVGRARAPSALFGLLGGLAIAIEYTNAVVVPWLALYLIVSGRCRTREPGALTALAGAAAMPLLGLAVYNHACFGSVWSTSYAYTAGPSTGQGAVELGPSGVSLPGFRAPIAAGLRDLLWGGDKVGRGLLVSSPVLALCVFSLACIWRREKAALLVFAAAPLALLLALARYRIYWGGSSGDTRYVLAVVPLLAVPLALLWDDLGALGRVGRAMRAAVLALAAFSILASARAVATSDGHPIREFRWPASPWDARLDLAALFPAAGNVPVALGWLLAVALAASLRGTARAGWTPMRSMTVALFLPLLWLSPVLRGGGAARSHRWEYSADGREWAVGDPPLSAPGPVLHVRWFIDQPDRATNVLRLRVGECLAGARVNKIVRWRDAACPPGSAAGPPALDVSNFVSPGLNLVELEVRASDRPAILHGASTQAAESP